MNNEGRGVQGVAIPGCPETYQDYPQQQRRPEGQSHHQQQGDHHQKVRQIKEGDVLLLEAGVAHWIFNNGQSNLVLISLYDVGNAANQLDQLFRKFFLAGSPPEEFQGTSQSQGGGRRHRQPSEGGQQGQEGGNIFSGFSQDLLAQALNIDRELANKMQRNDPHRGIIVQVRDEFRVITPERRGREQQEEQEEEEEEEQYPQEQEGRGQPSGSSNGLEETVCTQKLKHNIKKPHLADVYNPRAGRATSANGHTLPILNKYQLSMELVSLYQNAFYAPHWNTNAHSIAYITRGSGRVQISSERGETVFDGEVQEGELFVVPQGYAVLKKAGNNGLEWIAFKTHGMAKISQLVGRGSAVSAFPVDVLANAWGVSREQARRVKDGRSEMTLFSPSRRGGGHS